MESRAKLFGHPIHQMLIVLPLGMLSGAVIFDVLAMITSSISMLQPAKAFFEEALGISVEPLTTEEARAERISVVADAGGGMLVTAVALVLPSFLNGSQLLTASTTVVFVLIFSSLSLMVGLSRQVSLSHAVFVGLGATTMSQGRSSATSASLSVPLRCELRVIRAMIAANADDFDLHVLLARLLYDKDKNVAGALEALDTADKISPDNPAAIARRSSRGVPPERIAIATFGPTPETEVRCWKRSRSSSLANHRPRSCSTSRL